MIRISPSIRIDEKDLSYEFIRSAGPGGQNVNKVATAVQLRFDLRNASSLPPDVKSRLAKLAGRRLTQDGILIIEAKRYRTQEQNRSDATQRLITLVQKATVKPKTRRATRPSAGAKAMRMEEKKRRGVIKQFRQTKPNHDD